MRPSVHHVFAGPMTMGAVAGILLAASAAQAEASCRSALDQAESSWRTLSLEAPDKPAQAHVPESHAHAIPVDGALYTYLADQLRFAAASCRDGKEAEARAALTAFAKALPAPSGPSRG